MPKSLPLHRADFDDLFSTGSRARVDGITVYLRTRGDELPARLGLAIPKREGGAVVRNRIRRRLRAAFVQCERPGVDVAIRASSEVAGADFQELVKNLEVALARAEATA